MQVKLERHLIDSHKVKNDAVLKTLVVTKPISVSNTAEKQQIITTNNTSNQISTNISNHSRNHQQQQNVIGEFGNDNSRNMKQEENAISNSTHHHNHHDSNEQGMIKRNLSLTQLQFESVYN